MRESIRIAEVSYGDPQESRPEWTVCRGSRILARMGRGVAAKRIAVILRNTLTQRVMGGSKSW